MIQCSGIQKLPTLLGYLINSQLFERVAEPKHLITVSCASTSTRCPSSTPKLTLDKPELPAVFILSKWDSTTISTRRVSSLGANWKNSIDDPSQSSFNQSVVYVSRTRLPGGSPFSKIPRRMPERLLRRSFRSGCRKSILSRKRPNSQTRMLRRLGN